MGQLCAVPANTHSYRDSAPNEPSTRWVLCIAAVAALDGCGPAAGLASGRRQNGPARPSRSRIAWLSSRECGRQCGERRSPHQAWASSLSLPTLVVAPSSRPASQRLTCSSDRKRFIVAQVKTMSSHQRAAGTRQWKSKAVVIGTLIAYRDPRRLAAVTAGGLNPPALVQRGADAERIPGAVAKPPPPGGVNPVRGRDAGERVRHPDRAGRVEDQRVSVVQPLPAGLDLRLAQARGTGHLGRRGPAAEVDEPRLRQGQQ